MTIIAHVSDPHFGRTDPKVETALLRDLQELPPNLVIVSGDITQRARRRQFQAARRFIDALPATPRLIVPGNHDIPLFDVLTRAASPYRLYRRHICAELEPYYCDESLVVVCLNSTRARRHKHGEISAAQIEDTERRLSDLRQPFKLVVLHHPLAVSLPCDVRNRARGAEQALARWIAAGADLFLGGHIHLPYCISVRSARASALVLQAGTAVSTRTRAGAPNSYNRVTLQISDRGRRVSVERRDYDAAMDRFSPHSACLATATAQGWEIGVDKEAGDSLRADAARVA